MHIGKATTHSTPCTKTFTLTGLMAALICILSPLAFPLPFSPVPISFGTLAICFSAYVLGLKKGSLSVLIYILLGLAGLPVFTGFMGGPGKLFGPTGGYITGYLFLALICGFFADKGHGKWQPALFGMLLGTLVCYLFGTAWLAFQTHVSFLSALAVGVLPFIPGDLVKITIAMLLGGSLRKALIRAHLI